jgi:glycosyltransferase involved in cell wall biosynthesis
MIDSTHNTSEPLVLILMGTFNGQKYIREQLDSIACQTHKNWKLVISDDGSTDQTLEIAKEWASEVGVDRVEFREGPRNGFAQNFLSIACDSSLNADFYAFCDQDDVWKKDKLEAALHLLIFTESKCEPCLYCGRTQYVNDRLETLGCSPLFSRPPSFINALVQSLAGGNTMLFNGAAKSLMEQMRSIDQVVSHDWWAYLLVTGYEGVVIYDKTPRVLYRQHTANLVGESSNFLSRLLRLRLLLKGSFRAWTDQHVQILRENINFLSTKNKKVFECFAVSRESNTFERYLNFKRLGIHRQTRLDNLGLLIAVLLNKI